MNRNSMPKADVALKISQALGRSIEYLLGEHQHLHSLQVRQGTPQTETELYQKYSGLISALEKLQPQAREAICDVAMRLAESESGAKDERLYRIKER